MKPLFIAMIFFLVCVILCCTCHPELLYYDQGCHPRDLSLVFSSDSPVFFPMGVYSASFDADNSAKARADHLRVSFKNTRETAAAITGMSLRKAIKYLSNVRAHKECIPFRRFKGGVGRCAQVKPFKGVTQGRWPEKSCAYLLDLLKNAGANAEKKGLKKDKMMVKHVQVNQAPKQRRRTYRAHGRINAYMAHPCHVEIILTKKSSVSVPKATEEEKKIANAQKWLKLNKRQVARRATIKAHRQTMKVASA